MIHHARNDARKNQILRGISGFAVNGPDFESLATETRGGFPLVVSRYPFSMVKPAQAASLHAS